MHKPASVILRLCLPALAGAVLAAGQAGQPANQQPLTFKVDVNYVEIDATVADGNGGILRDLAREDFQVVEDGKPQTIAVFSRVEVPIERPDPPLFKASATEPDVRTNQREFDGRVFVLVLDDLHTAPMRTAHLRRAASEFVRQYLGANDLAAVVHVRGGRAAGQEFTSSRARLLRSIETFSGIKFATSGPIKPNEAEVAHNARSLGATLRNVAEYLGGVRGRRKALILFSEGIDYDLVDQIKNRYASDITQDLRAATAAATRSNVSFYTVDPRGLVGFDPIAEMAGPAPDDPGSWTAPLDALRRSQDSLRVLAEETGGLAVVNRNDYRESFARIVAENSSYYVIGYYSDNARRDGRFRAVDVRVRRPGVTVRAKKGYTGPRGTPAPAKPVGAAGASREVREVLASPLPMSGLGLSAAAWPFRGAGVTSSVLMAFEIDGAKLTFVDKGGTVENEIEILAVPFDGSGNAQEGTHDSIRLTPKPETLEALRTRGVRTLRRFELKPGRYQLRIAARESGGAAGSVLLDLDVPDFRKGPLAMSGIVLTSTSAGSRPTARADEALKGVLQTAPNLAREFDNNDELTVFAEVYDHIPASHGLQIATTLTRDDGRVAFNHTDERRSDELRARGDGFGHVRAIPLAGLAPGRYVLRVDARAQVADAPTVSRELEVSIR